METNMDEDGVSKVTWVEALPIMSRCAVYHLTGVPESQQSLHVERWT